jgi:hypothetical protein
MNHIVNLVNLVYSGLVDSGLVDSGLVDSGLVDSCLAESCLVPLRALTTVEGIMLEDNCLRLLSNTFLKEKARRPVMTKHI